MRIRAKGYTLLEVMVALFLSGFIVILMTQAFNAALKHRKGIESSQDIHAGGVIVSETIVKRIRYSSPDLVTIYPLNPDNSDSALPGECLAVGFAVLDSLPTSFSCEPYELGFRQLSYECLDSLPDTVTPKTWQTYMLYYFDKEGRFMPPSTPEEEQRIWKSTMYEIKYAIKAETVSATSSTSSKLGYSSKSRYATILQKMTLKEWAEKLNINPELFPDETNTSETQLNKLKKDIDSFYYSRLDSLLDIAEVERTNIKKISTNIYAFQASLDYYPAIKMNLVMQYGQYGTTDSNVRSASKMGTETSKANELFDLNWSVVPVN